MAASVALLMAAAMFAAAASFSAGEIVGPSSTRSRLRGDVRGSGGPLTIQKPKGAPETGFGIGVPIVARSRRQASCNTARVWAAGRAATEPQTTTFGVVDMLRVRRSFACNSGKTLA